MLKWVDPKGKESSFSFATELELKLDAIMHATGKAVEEAQVGLLWAQLARRGWHMKAAG